MWAELAGIGANLIKRHEDQEQAMKDRVLAAQTQLYSPWTDLKAGPITKAASPIAAALQGGLAGAQQGQAIDQADAASKLQQAQLSALNGGNPWMSMNQGKPNISKYDDRVANLYSSNSGNA